VGREDAFASGSQRRTEHPSEKPMEFMFGEPDRRPARVTACAGRTVAIRDAERDTSLHALIGVELDARVPMTRAQVRRDALRQLRIPEHLMLVTKMKDATFLLRFEQPAMRSASLARGMLAAGPTRLHLLPWTRQFGATAASKAPVPGTSLHRGDSRPCCAH